MLTVKKGYTYGDLLLEPKHASVVPADVSLKSMFSTNIPLNIPIVSSPMDRVTRHKLAIALALEGGLGIIERNLSIELQAEEVRKVKRHKAYVISDPWTLRPNDTIGEVRTLMREKNISGIPVIDDERRLVGILTKHDLQFNENGDTRRVSELMTKAPLVTGYQGMPIPEARERMKLRRVKKLPLIDTDGRLVGLMTAKDLSTREYPNSNIDVNGQLYVGGAIGATKDYYERGQALVEAGADVLVIDTAHGDSDNVVAALLRLKAASGMVDVVAGNIATASGVLVLAGADANGLRTGIGPGSICITRDKTGNGVPQVSAIDNVKSELLRTFPKSRISVIADGGISESGDSVKGLAAGADCVMLGRLFAETEEAAGEIQTGPDGRKYRDYRGMGSEAVLFAGGDRYGAKAVPEGVEGEVDVLGPLWKIVQTHAGGIQQGMGYQGSRTIAELQDHPVFYEISAAGAKESHVHGVRIRNTAPNYTAP